ncbi:HNH endonuclease signature motif containing protein [Amycolatopsis sp.]|uniref:HNH endonuclease n=1 Tax=Amycolatopsis sp. TaxID=37632 RepID=UPI00345A0DA3
MPRMALTNRSGGGRHVGTATDARHRTAAAFAMSGGWQRAQRRVHSREWHRTMAIVARRSHGRCEVVENGQRCGAPARDTDHVTPHSAGGSDRVENARRICDTHHRAKSAAEGLAARGVGPRTLRPVPPHPGLRPAGDQPTVAEPDRTIETK